MGKDLYQGAVVNGGFSQYGHRREQVMRLELTSFVESDLNDIANYIAQDNLAERAWISNNCRKKENPPQRVK